MAKHIKTASVAEKRGSEDAPQVWILKGRDSTIRSAETLREETTRIRAGLWSQLLREQPEKNEPSKR